MASDHAGPLLKKKLGLHLRSKGFEVFDLGPDSEESVDYPDYADKVCKEVSKDPENLSGILICGSGQGMVMRANKYKGIRAALCWTEEVARLARQHNKANILCMGARLGDENLALKIADVFFSEDFEGGRHQRRVDKINLPTV